MHLEGLRMTEGSSRPRAFLKGPQETVYEGVEEEKTEDHAVDLLVGGCPPDVSRGIFASLNDAGIVYDGRLVVDESFRTSEPSIYASGSVAKLSRRLGGSLLEHWSSKECGVKLAESVSSLFLPSLAQGSSVDASGGSSVKTVDKAKSVGCNLPGGLIFLYTGLPSAMSQPSLGPPSGGRVVRTCTRASGLFQITLDAKQRVHNVVTLGPRSSQEGEGEGAWVRNLVGLPASYLNGLVEKVEGGQVADIKAYFSQPWAEALRHDEFVELRVGLVKQAKASRSISAPVPAAVVASRATIEFIVNKGSELAGAYGSGLKEWKEAALVA